MVKFNRPRNLRAKAGGTLKKVGGAINKAPAKYKGFQDKIKLQREIGRKVEKDTPAYYQELRRVTGAAYQKDPNSTYGMMFQKYLNYSNQGMDDDNAMQTAHDEVLSGVAQKRTIKSKASGAWQAAKKAKTKQGWKDLGGKAKDKLNDAKKTASATKDASAEDLKQAGLSWPAAVSGAGSKIKYRMYEAVFYIIGGIFALFLPNFLGLGAINLSWLSMALIFCMPAYTLFWSESDIKRKLAESGDEDEIGASVALLMPKAMAKIVAFVLIIWNFTMINLLLALATAFVFYFSLKASYKSNQPYRMIESFARMGFGLWIAFLLMTTFSSVAQVGLSLALMAVAFFFVLPINKDSGGDSGGQNVVVSLKDKISNFRGSAADKIIFFVLMLISLLMAFMGNPTGGLFGTSQTIFFAVWLLSLIMGYSAGPEGRPAIGILMIFIALFAFSGMYTSVVGQAVFGYWWPQVESFGETFLGPLNEAWAQAQSGMGDAWMMMTNPQAYYLKLQQQQQATKSVVTSGGTVKSIEFNKVELMPSIIGTLEPTEPIIGNIELQNQGEFTSAPAEGAAIIGAVGYAVPIQVDITTSWKNPDSLKNIPKGAISNLKCSGSLQPSSYGSVSGYGSSSASCSMPKTYPSESRSVNFVLDKDSWTNLGTDCEYAAIDPETEQPGDATDCDCPCDAELASGSIVTYKHSGESVKMTANVTYWYNVNVTIPFRVINSVVYQDKLKAGEIVLEDLTSEYTGGPVKATIWTPKQPSRSGEAYLVVASIYNDGPGVIKFIAPFNISISSDYVSMINVIATTFKNDTDIDGCTPHANEDAAVKGGFYFIECYFKGNIKPQEYKRVSFYVTPKDVPDEKTSIIIGRAAYQYVKSNSQTLTMANAPPQ
jgi:hypothetical protein